MVIIGVQGYNGGVRGLQRGWGYKRGWEIIETSHQVCNTST